MSTPVPPANRFAPGRLEAFSDGVIAIDITLLIFNLQLPRLADASASLLQALAAQWPEYLAFFISFLMIGVMWVNHHNLFRIIHQVDHTLLLLNLLLLLGMTFVPFPTRIIAAYLTTPQSHEAAALYAVTFLVIALFFQLLWRYAAWNNRLLAVQFTPAAIHSINWRYNLGFGMYLLAVGAAFISAYLTLAMMLGLAVFFALSPRSTMS